MCYVRLFLSFIAETVSELAEKYSVSLKKLLQQGISEPEFYGDLVHRIETNCGEIYFFFRTIQKAY